MNKIYTLDDEFNFDDIELEHPNSLQGGSYFTRMNIHSSPVYIQTNPCSTKNGIVKTAKKSYCDLMFNSHDDKAIQWFEQLERQCIDAIFQKKDLWFHNDMELDDIETSFTSPIRLYKSGKNYLIRCNIANNSLSSGTFKCYDEHTNPVSLDKLDNSAVKIIPLLEIQGIRFTSKNFTLELALKQIMIIEDPDFMNECFIQPENIKSIRQKTNNNKSIDSSEYNKELATEEPVNKLIEESDNNLDSKNVEIQNISDSSDNNESSDILKNSKTMNISETQETQETQEPQEIQGTSSSEYSSNTLDDSKSESIQDSCNEKNSIHEEQLGSEVLSISNEPLKKSLGNSSSTILDEVTLDYNNLGNEKVKLKTPEEVYYDLWYEARSRAKLAREEAIKAYLEAKNIKNLYMLDNFSDSEDEFEEYLEE